MTLLTARFATGLSTHPEPAVAVGEALGAVVEQVGFEPDLAVAFASGSMIDSLGDTVDSINQLLSPRSMMAVGCGGVLGGAAEVEAGNAIVIWAGRTGPVRPLRLEALSVGGSPTFLGLPRLDTVGTETEPDESPPVMLLVADPFSFPVERFLEDLDELAPGVAVVGGMASAGRAPGENRLWLDGVQYTDGAVGVLLPRDVVEIVVSQGCRPIGTPWVVTDGGGQMVRCLAGRPALERLSEMVSELSPEDRALASEGLHIGFVVNQNREQFRTGDFLVRGVLGAERNTGAVAVAGTVEVGQVVQFHVREPAAATVDLARLLPETAASGALVFTCNARGTHFFDQAHHDAALVHEHAAGGVAGMFCAGEIGPVGDDNALHSLTATVLLFP